MTGYKLVSAKAFWLLASLRRGSQWKHALWTLEVSANQMFSVIESYLAALRVLLGSLCDYLARWTANRCSMLILKKAVWMLSQ